MLELIKARLDVFQNESGREGVDFIIKTDSGKYHELFIQSLNLDSSERSVKILKQEIGAPKENLWVALVLFMKEIEPKLYLIPSKVISKPDNYIFIDNDQGERFPHLSNWEIKVFGNGIKELSKYALTYQIKNL